MSDIFAIYQLALQKALRQMDEEQKSEMNNNTKENSENQKATNIAKTDYTPLKTALTNWGKAKYVSIMFILLTTMLE